LILYLDSSALVKIYVEEAGSDKVRQAVERAAVSGTSQVSRVESIAAFKKLTRKGALPLEKADACVKALRSDWSDLFQLEVQTYIVDSAAALAWDLDLRGNDAIQLASALRWKKETSSEVTFASWDSKQREAARTVGLSTIPDPDRSLE
jgi:predicted nucleic acid-binding protein